MVVELDDELWFPDPHVGEPDGLLAIGGDLSIDRLLLAYSHGIFPWFSFRGGDEPVWYCPMERFVIFPSEIHVSHSMRTLINKRRYGCTFNNDFHGVITHCSQLRIHEQGAWLGENMIKAYEELYRQGFALSVEVWDMEDGKKLVGGLYGVTIGRNVFGESMFSLVPSASKLALIYLARNMLGQGIIDCQFKTDHLESMGGRYISYDEYMERLNQK